MDILDQIKSFRTIVLDCVHRGKSNQTIDELFDEWHVLNPSPHEFETDAKAIAASICDLDRGEHGKPIQQFLDEFKTLNQTK